MNEGRVAVILLNYNQWEMTAECVGSVLNSDYPDFRVLLIDNGSHSMEDYEKLQKFRSDRCELIRLDKNRGYVGGMNHGMEQASRGDFDFFLVMNNDAVIAPDAISRLVECSGRYGHRCIVTGKVYNYDRPHVIQHIGYEFTDRKNLRMKRLAADVEDSGQWDTELEMDMIDDIFWLFPAALYSLVGGYSHSFWFSAEQADLALRASDAGYKLIYAPAARLWHKGSLSIGGRENNPAHAYYDLQGALVFRFLHLDKFRFTFFYAGVVFNIAKGYIKHIIRRLGGASHDRKMADAAFRALLWFNRWLVTREENTGLNPFSGK